MAYFTLVTSTLLPFLQTEKRKPFVANIWQVALTDEYLFIWYSTFSPFFRVFRIGAIAFLFFM